MRYKKAMREQIDKCILDADLAQLTVVQSIQYIQEKTGLILSRSQIGHRRKGLRQANIGLWEKHRSDEYAFKLEHLKRIQEMEVCMSIAQQDLLRFKDDDKRFFFRQKCIYEIIDVSKRLSDLYYDMRKIDAIGHGYIEDGEMDEGLSELESESNGQMAAQTGRVF